MDGFKSSEFVALLLVVFCTIAFKLDGGAGVGVGIAAAGYAIGRGLAKRGGS